MSIELQYKNEIFNNLQSINYNTDVVAPEFWHQESKLTDEYKSLFTHCYTICLELIRSSLDYNNKINFLEKLSIDDILLLWSEFLVEKNGKYYQKKQKYLVNYYNKLFNVTKEDYLSSFIQFLKEIDIYLKDNEMYNLASVKVGKIIERAEKNILYRTTGKSKLYYDEAVEALKGIRNSIAYGKPIPSENLDVLEDKAIRWSNINIPTDYVEYFPHVFNDELYYKRKYLDLKFSFEELLNSVKDKIRSLQYLEYIDENIVSLNDEYNTQIENFNNDKMNPGDKEKYLEYYYKHKLQLEKKELYNNYFSMSSIENQLLEFLDKLDKIDLSYENKYNILSHVNDVNQNLLPSSTKEDELCHIISFRGELTKYYAKALNKFYLLSNSHIIDTNAPIEEVVKKKDIEFNEEIDAGDEINILNPNKISS